jgi:hypothetical protein
MRTAIKDTCLLGGTHDICLGRHLRQTQLVGRNDGSFSKRYTTWAHGRMQDIRSRKCYTSCIAVDIAMTDAEELRCSCSLSDMMTSRHALHQMDLLPLDRISNTTSRGGSGQPPRPYSTTLKSHRQASMFNRASRRSRVRCGSWRKSLFQPRVPLWDLRSHMSYDNGAVADASGC